MIRLISAGLHGDGSADEVRVLLDVDGEERVELLRDNPDLARQYRDLNRRDRAAVRERDTQRDTAHRAHRAAIDAADAALAEAQRAHDAAIEAANVAFQAERDRLVDEGRESDRTTQEERTTLDAEAFAQAQAQIDAREAPANP